MSSFDRNNRPGAAPEAEESSSPGGESQSLRELALRRRMIQRKASSLAGHARALGEADAPKPAAKGAGAPLPTDVRAEMEGAFGAELSDVRVHQSGAAEQLGARAFTEGSDVHMAPGQYDPTSKSGKQLLGHELTHVVQQRAGRVTARQGKGAAINDDAALEGEADAIGDRAAAGERVQVTGSSAGLADKSAGTIQAKLNFDAAKLTAAGGGSSFASKLTGGSYHKLVGLLKSYQALYDKNHQDPGLEAILKNIQATSNTWLNKHKTDKPERQQAVQALLVESTRELAQEQIAFKEASAWAASRSGRDAKPDDAGGGEEHKGDADAKDAGGGEHKADGGGPGGASAARQPPPVPARPPKAMVASALGKPGAEAKGEEHKAVGPDAKAVAPEPPSDEADEQEAEELKAESHEKEDSKGDAVTAGGLPASGQVEAMKAKLGGGIPMAMPGATSRGMVRDGARSGGDAEFKSQAPQPGAAMPQSQGEGIAIQNALRAAEEAVNAGKLEAVVGEDAIAGIVELLDQLAADVAQWTDAPPKASDQIALLNLLAQIQSANPGGIRAALANFGIDVDEDKDDEKDGGDPEAKDEVKADGEDEVKADDKADVKVDEEEEDEEEDSASAPDKAYLAHQQAKLGKVGADRTAAIQKKGAVGYQKDAAKSAGRQKIKGKVKGLAVTAVGAGAGHLMPGVSQAYSLVRAINQVRSTVRHIKNLRRLRKDAVASGRHKEGDVAVSGIDYAIAQKSKKKTRSAIGGVPLVGTAKTVVMKLKGLYKQATGDRGKDRRAWADCLISEAKKGDRDVQLVILELVGKDQYNLVVDAPQGLDLLVAKLASN
jgi:hypothetical protein